MQRFSWLISGLLLAGLVECRRKDPEPDPTPFVLTSAATQPVATMQVSSDGGNGLLAGFGLISGPYSTHDHMGVVRVDGRGKRLWSNQYAAPFLVSGGQFVGNNRGAALLVGQNRVGANLGPVLGLAALAADGSVQWARQVSWPGEIPQYIGAVPCPDGGWIAYAVMGGNNADPLCIVRLDAGGQLQWHRRLRGPASFWGVQAAPTPVGGLALFFAGSSGEARLSVLDGSGNPSLTTVISNGFFPSRVKALPGGDFVVATEFGVSEYTLMRLSASGQLTAGSQVQLPVSNSGSSQHMDLAFADDGAAYLTMQHNLVVVAGPYQGTAHLFVVDAGWQNSLGSQQLLDPQPSAHDGVEFPLSVVPLPGQQLGFVGPTGTRNRAQPPEHFVLLRTDAAGRSGCAQATGTSLRLTPLSGAVVTPGVLSLAAGAPAPQLTTGTVQVSGWGLTPAISCR